jgi:hypothetical protein
MTATLPIEEVRLGQRVPSRSPIPNAFDEIEKSSDYAGWKVIRLEVRHQNGSVVDMELLRPYAWIEQNGMRAGTMVDLRMTELKADAVAHIVSVSDGPEILPGEGAVVIGRFVTRAGSDLVRVTFADGTQLTGTKTHPAWSPMDSAWMDLGEFEPGRTVQTRSGTMPVVSIEEVPDRPPVYNIEVDGEHVYEVTRLGVLVHNNTPLCVQLKEAQAALEKVRLARAAAKNDLDAWKAIRDGERVGTQARLDANEAMKSARGKVGGLANSEKNAAKRVQEIELKLAAEEAAAVKAARARFPKVADPKALENALSDFQSRKWFINGENVLLDKAGMTHILERHHPSFWDGSIKASQSFFGKKLTPSQIEAAIGEILKQNRARVAEIGANGIGSMTGTVDGVRYQLGLNRGRVGQFFPVE